MACIDLNLTLPTIPGIFLGAPSIPNVPLLQGSFCCQFSVMPEGVNDLINTANAAIQSAVSAGAAALMGPIMGVNVVIAQVQAQINQIRSRFPDCPLDSKLTNIKA